MAAKGSASGALAVAEHALATKLVPIEKIQPGDFVLAVPENDPATEPRPCKVLQAFHNPPNIIWEIRVDAGIIDSTDVVKTTAGHPFFVKSKGSAAQWRQAQDIQVGDKLRTPDGRWVIVDNVLCTKHRHEVFNLEVEDAHTYFVALPNSGKAVWVHNTSVLAGEAVTASPDTAGAFTFGQTVTSGALGRWVKPAPGQYPKYRPGPSEQAPSDAVTAAPSVEAGAAGTAADTAAAEAIAGSAIEAALAVLVPPVSVAVGVGVLGYLGYRMAGPMVPLQRAPGSASVNVMECHAGASYDPNAPLSFPRLEPFPNLPTAAQIKAAFAQPVIDNSSETCTTGVAPNSDSSINCLNPPNEPVTATGGAGAIPPNVPPVATGFPGDEGPNWPQTRAALEADLASRGFINKGTNPGGYTTYVNPDGRVVTIKPTGEVIPTSPATSAEGRQYNQRTDYNFNRLPDQSHSTGHFVEPINGRTP